MHDKRLIGRWRSDGRKTRKDIAVRRDISNEDAKALGKLFGKLELRFTRTRCYATLNDLTFSSQYIVLGKDATSVATLSDGVISHIRFEGNRFWVAIGTGTVREFFRRITES
jgi:hypothetical protein